MKRPGCANGPFASLSHSVGRSAPTSALLLRANVDRLVAGGRVVLAAVAFVAVATVGALMDRWRVLGLVAIGAYVAVALAQFAIVMRTLHAPRALARIEFGLD